MEQRLQSAARAMQPAQQQAGQRSGNRRRTLSGAGADSGVVPEARAHDDFLAKHGPCRGWHPDDAATFDQAFRCEHARAVTPVVVLSSLMACGPYKRTAVLVSQNQLSVPDSRRCASVTSSRNAESAWEVCTGRAEGIMSIPSAAVARPRCPPSRWSRSARTRHGTGRSHASAR